MDANSKELIEALSAKLGTTAEHLWGVLVRQAPISGAVDIMLCIFVISLAVWVLYVVNEKTSMKSTDDDRHNWAEWEDESALLAWFVAIIFCALVIILVGVSADDIVSAFANPEYWALKQLIK